MYRLMIIAVGALKEPFWKDAIAEYGKRLGPFAKVRVVEVPDVPFKSLGEAATVMKAEAKALRTKIPEGAFTIALDKGGRALSTEGFSETVRREGEGGRCVAFLLGGPLGLDPALAASCHARLSLSSMTFTHGQARAILFEQLYRAMTILSGKAYHY